MVFFEVVFSIAKVVPEFLRSILHLALIRLLPRVPNTILARILSLYSVLEPSRRHEILEDSKELEDAYQKAALDGDSEAPSDPEEEVDFHYTCFVKSSTNERLYELDGDRPGPIDLAVLEPGDDILCETGLKAVRDYVAAQGVDKIGFSLLALVPI